MTTNETTASTTEPLDENPPEERVPQGPPKGIGGAIEHLLKYPMHLVRHLQEGDGPKMVRNLFIVTVICLLVFGLILGTFSGGTQLWASPLKICLGLLVSGLICLPSLYIFSCLTGLDVKFATAAGILVAAGCLTSLLLVGFAPVVWVFSQSTESIAFMGFLALVFWMIALYFAGSLVLQAGKAFGGTRKIHLAVWGAIFVIVSLQMTTALRPIIGESETLLPTEKKFFLTHWFEQMDLEAAEIEAKYR